VKRKTPVKYKTNQKDTRFKLYWVGIALLLAVVLVCFIWLRPYAEAPGESFPIVVNGKEYSFANYRVREQLGLPSISEEIVKDDLGEPLGVVESCGYEDYIGAQVYYFSEFPEDDRVCVLKYKRRFLLYCLTDYKNLVTNGSVIPGG